jgi:hypothetical protein
MDGNVKGDHDSNSLELQDDGVVGGNGYLLLKIGACDQTGIFIPQPFDN